MGGSTRGNPTQQRQETDTLARGAALGQLAAFSVPLSPHGRVHPRGPVSHFPRPRGLRGRCLPLQQSLLCSAGFTSQPFPLVLQTKVLRVFGASAGSSAEVGKWTPPGSGLARQRLGLAFLLPCPLPAQGPGPPSPPRLSGNPHLLAQVVGVQPREH